MASGEKKKRPGPPPRTTGAFARIKMLPRYREVHERLERGESCERIAKLIQIEWNQCLDVTERGLIRQLYRYREREVKWGRVVEALDWRCMDRIKARVGNLETLIERQDWMVNILTAEIVSEVKRGRSCEEQGGFAPPSPQFIKLAREFRETLGSYADLLFRAGIIIEPPKALGLGIHAQVLAEGAEVASHPAGIRLREEERMRLPLARGARELIDFIERGKFPDGRPGSLEEDAFVSDGADSREPSEELDPDGETAKPSGGTGEEGGSEL